MATHWGWYWKVKKKHLPKTLCSKLSALDASMVFKRSDFSWFRVEPMGIKARLVDDAFEVTYGKQKNKAYKIKIDKQSCNYGGYRYYFRCPLCQRRMRLLYLAQNSMLLCRKCLNLSYKTQRLRPTLRYDHMSNKIKTAIKSRGGDLDHYKKPPRMHNTNYNRLRNKQFYYESKSHQALNNELRAWYGARVEPYIDEYFDYVDENEELRKQ